MTARLMIGEDRAAALDVVRVNHYTHSVPSGKTEVYAFEDCLVLFSIPANYNISKWLVGETNRVWELSRLWAPDGHRHNLLTQAISAAVSSFRAAHPEIYALVSYADPNVGHQGGVYRAASWVFLGQCEESRAYRDPEGRVVSRRAFHSGSKGLRKVEILAKGYEQLKLPGKLRFAKALSRQARKLLPESPKPF